VSPALPLRTEKVQSPVIQAVPLGVLAPLSGPGASYGQDVVEVVKRFAGVFNASHADAHIDVIVENGGCNGKDATIAASKLIDVDKVVAIIGGVCSSETLAAGLLAQEAGMPMIAPGSASSAISAIGDRVVRTNANTAAASVLADAVTEKYRRVLVIAEQKDYPKDMADRFAERVDAEVEMIAFQSDDHDMTVLAKQIALEDADALFVFTQSEATSIPLMLALDEE
jgi:branched-chain amino acid transport system substrate-binding protein